MPDIKRMMKESTDPSFIRRQFSDRDLREFRAEYQREWYGSAGLQPCVIEPIARPPLSKGFVITVSVIAFLAASAGFFALGSL